MSLNCILHQQKLLFKAWKSFTNIVFNHRNWVTNCQKCGKICQAHGNEKLAASVALLYIDYIIWWTQPYLTPNNLIPTLSLIQGQSRQTGFFELALRDRNMQVRFIWKLLSKSRDLRNFASVTSFHEMYNVRHLWPNLQTWKKKFGKKILNVTNVKLFFNKKFNVLWGFFMFFCFNL